MKITIADILSHNPCKEYDETRLRELYAGRDALTPQEIAELDISIEDRLWALIHTAMDDRSRRLFACDCAERAQHELDTDPRNREAVRICIAHADNAAAAATHAYAAATHAAAYAAATHAADAAAYAAAYAAAATHAAAKAAARKWQLECALQYCEENE